MAEYVKLQVRMDGPLHERLVAAAAEGKRSLNSEVLHRLQSTFDPASTAPGELEAAAYRSHSLMLESQAFQLQSKLGELMAQKTAMSGKGGEAAEALQDQIRWVEHRILALDKMASELRDRAQLLALPIGIERQTSLLSDEPFALEKTPAKKTAKKRSR